MTLNTRIKIAKFTGWKLVDGWWINPDQSNLMTRTRADPPDPENDANDCNALIKHLNGLGWSIFIEHVSDGKCNLQAHCGDPYRNFHQSFDNWMHGVCELALKVLK